MATSTGLFDMVLRAARRDRAARTGPVLFLYERAFSDILERLGDVSRKFDSALLLGVPDAGWSKRLESVAGRVFRADPGALFAEAAGGVQLVEDRLDVEPASFDLAVAIGTLDTVNDLPQALLRLRFALRPDSLLIGAISGGGTLPGLRQAMRAADAATGAASAHVHPRIEPAALAQLLGSAGFTMPVVDVDRASVSYSSFGKLVGDLRGMGVTNLLSDRSKAPLGRAALRAAEQDFEGDGAGSTVETFEILHFAAWTSAS